MLLKCKLIESIYVPCCHYFNILLYFCCDEFNKKNAAYVYDTFSRSRDTKPFVDILYNDKGIVIAFTLIECCCDRKHIKTSVSILGCYNALPSI